MVKTENCLYLYIYIYVYIYISICMYMYIWYVHIPYIHSSLFVRDAHWFIYLATLAQETRLERQNG